ncbi:MAG: HEAT repeat domain-containing protein [Chloroflexi bacterium]|nr:HEAT repeat domain-containing protein [Chloroflexota bacterium]
MAGNNIYLEFFEKGTASCRRAIEALSQGNTPAGFKPFPLPGDKPRYAPDRQYVLKHLFIDVALDLPTKSVSGRVRTTFNPVNDGLRQLVFDAADLDVKTVKMNGRNLEFRSEGEKLYVTLLEPGETDEEMTIEIAYSATPRRGLYFIAPEPEYPDKVPHVWTQGQDTDNHFWLPCFDAPNQKCTTEMRVVVPEDFFALSNGALIENSHDAGAKTRTFHWKQNIPHSSYLITLAAGPFSEVADKWEDIPVPYYVLPGHEEEARISLGRTPDMVEFFSKNIGVRYPYEKYATVCVQDFIFGGMENTSATTLTDTTLHDSRADQDFSSQPLAAHELAHQWFGDLLTCRDWSNGWLNEGFATYFEALWTEHSLGRDEFIYEMHGNAQAYFSEDKNRYRRPLVAYTFNQPIDLFDRHLYEKGSLVLHMIRYLLGEAGWWKAINHYVTKHRGQNVISADFERAIEEATGRNLQYFFEQWVYKAGYPTFQLKNEWDEANQTVKFSVTQTQPTDLENPLFTLPVEIAFALPGGQRETFKVKLEEKTQNFYFKLPARPLFASFDPSNWLLKTVTWTRSKEALIAQLTGDTESFGRITAAQELGRLGGRDAVETLEKAFKTESVWTVRAEIAFALGKIGTATAESVLVAALPGENHPKVRRAIVTALGEFRDQTAVTTLSEVLKGDKTDIIEMAAAHALGKTRQPGVFDTLQAAMERDSFNQVVRQGAINGFVALKDVKALPLVLDWTAYGRPDLARFAAITALGSLGKLVKNPEKEQVIERLKDLLEDKNWRARMAAIGAVQALGDTSLLPTLQRKIELHEDSREVRRAREAVEAIRENASQGQEMLRLREDLDKLVTENRELRDRLESLEQKTPR